MGKFLLSCIMRKLARFSRAFAQTRTPSVVIIGRLLVCHVSGPLLRTLSAMYRVVATTDLPNMAGRKQETGAAATNIDTRGGRCRSILDQMMKNNIHLIGHKPCCAAGARANDREASIQST